METLIPLEVYEICRRLREDKHQAYLVGGAVRDLYLDKIPPDWDIVTDAAPGRVQELFSKTVPTGVKYGTITVLLDGKGFEVTTMRRDGDYIDGRRPETVSYTLNLAEDLARRDFTINAMAFDPLKQELIDPFKGRNDLRRKIIRTVGDPQERFKEDALRMMRLLRFISTLGFRAEKKTILAIRPEWIINVSSERIRDEFTKLLTGEKTATALEGMADTGIIQKIIPEILPCLKEKGYGRYSIWNHLVLCAQAIQPEIHLRMAALFHDIAKPLVKTHDEKGMHFWGHENVGEEMAGTILTRLRFNKETIQKVKLLIRHHMFSTPPDCSDAALRRLINRVGKDYIIDLLELRRADVVAIGRQEWRALKGLQILASRIDCLFTGEMVFTIKDLAISGEDIMEILQISPGPKVGEILNKLWQRVTEEPELNRKEKLVEILNQDNKNKISRL